VGVPTAVVAVLAAAFASAEQATVVVKMQLLAATSDRLQVCGDKLNVLIKDEKGVVKSGTRHCGEVVNHSS
jgi:hypothetical protein